MKSIEEPLDPSRLASLCKVKQSSDNFVKVCNSRVRVIVDVRMYVRIWFRDIDLHVAHRLE